MTFAERFEAGVLSRNCLRAGFLLIWTSVLIIPIGTYLQIKAPGFEKYQKKLEAEMEARNPEADAGPAMFAAMVFAVPTMCCFSLLIGLMFTFGMSIVYSLTLWRRDVGLLVAGVFLGGCLLGSLLSIVEGLQGFHWGFNVLGVGYLVSAAGLALGGVGSTGQCFFSLKNKPKPADPARFEL